MSDSLSLSLSLSPQGEVKLKEEISSLKQHCTQLEQTLRHMRSRNDDIISSLEARDTQIQILRTTLSECDSKIASLNKQIEEAGKERER